LFWLEIYPGLFLSTILSGLCIFASAFILSWSAELSQFYVSQSLAFILLALIAVLPEYTVDMYFAWTAAKKPEYVAFAAANMTGGNRLLIGLGWPLVVFFYFFKTGSKQILLDKTQKLEIKTLLLATIYSFIIPIKGNISLIDTIILISLFSWYFIQALKLGIKEPELEEGPVKILSQLPTRLRLILTIFFFAFAGYGIYISAEPFAEGLLGIGEKTGIDKFILVQWIAPLASEAPEIIVVLIFSLKLMPREGIRTLISSKINQWTLLIGMLPLIYSISSLKPSIMILDMRQIEEILLTAAQSLFALMIIYNLKFSLIEGIGLFSLFSTQLFFPSTTIRFFYSGLYIFLAFLIFYFHKKTDKELP